MISLLRTCDPFQTGKELLSEESLRGLAVTAVSAGAFQGLSNHLKLPTQPQGFVEQAKVHLTKAAVNTAAQTTIGGQSFKDTLQANLFKAAVDTAAGTAANKIGNLKTDGDINNVTHKVLHGGVGAIMGALLSKDRKGGAIAGAIGAITAEMVPESLTEDAAICKQRIVDQAKAKGKVLSHNELQNAYMAEVRKNAEWGKLVGAVVTLAAGKDVNIAMATASNAVEKNYLSQQARQAFMQASGTTPEEAVVRANELQQAITDNPELQEALQTLGLCAEEVNAQLYELQCMQGREQLRKRTDQDFWHDLQYPLGAAGAAAQAEFMAECYASHQPLGMVGRMCEALCVIEGFAQDNPVLMTILQDTIRLGAEALRVASYTACVSAGATMGSVFPGAGTFVGGAAGFAFAAGMEYSVDRAFTAIGSGMGGAVNWIKNQARQAGRTPAERLRFAHAAENGIYGSLAGLGLIAGGRGLKHLSSMGSSAFRMPYTSRMRGQTRNIQALGLETTTGSTGQSIHSLNPKIFNKTVSWQAPDKGTSQCYKIYQRNDVDWNMIRTKGLNRFIGKTNAEAAKAGLPPQLADGYLVTLHHIGQDARGPLVEASRKHHKFGQPGFRALHNQFGNSKNPNYPVDHKIFDRDIKEYWKNRENK